MIATEKYYTVQYSYIHYNMKKVEKEINYNNLTKLNYNVMYDRSTLSINSVITVITPGILRWWRNRISAGLFTFRMK